MGCHWDATWMQRRILSNMKIVIMNTNTNATSNIHIKEMPLGRHWDAEVKM